MKTVFGMGDTVSVLVLSVSLTSTGRVARSRVDLGVLPPTALRRGICDRTSILGTS